MQNSKILKPDDNALALLRAELLAQYPEAAEHLAKMDYRWLEAVALAHDGVLVILDEGKFLPAEMGVVMITLPFAALGEAFIHGKDVPPSPLDLAPTPRAQLTTPPPREIDPAKPMVALTFDDGPSFHTSTIIDLLEKYHVRATFFVVGQLINASRRPLIRAANLGYDVLGHSWDHQDLTKLNDEEIKTQLFRTRKAIKAVTGIETKAYRPPYGEVDERVERISRELGLDLVFWDLDPDDWKHQDADYLYDFILKKVKDKDIVLCHDMYGTTAQAMERVIPDLLGQGYQLVTVTELRNNF
jgi:peptidoglycan/xylan/chitin deacetylase (PgdA/CDA1 family)